MAWQCCTRPAPGRLQARWARRSPWRACETFRFGRSHRGSSAPVRWWAAVRAHGRAGRRGRLHRGTAARAAPRGPKAECSRFQASSSSSCRKLAQERRASRGSTGAVPVVVGPGAEVRAAFRAEAGAVGTADRRDRRRELDRLAGERLELQLVVVGQAEHLRLGGPCRAGRPVARSMLGSTSSSIAHADRDAGRAAGSARSVARGSWPGRPRHHDAAVRPGDVERSRAAARPATSPRPGRARRPRRRSRATSPAARPGARRR